MITRVHKGGATFAGLARYLTRDDRHAAIDTVNLSSRDARTSARIMQATANDSKLLKQLAGGSARGRPLKKPAHHFTGSWAPEENPSDAEMFAFGRRCLKALAFDDRQAVMVIHRDKTYRGQTRHELHVMTNRVSSKNGRAAPDDDDAIRLSAVAKVHEKEQGRIYVRSRFEQRPSAERERKRMRGPNGTTTPMTPFERGQFAAKKVEHAAQRTPIAQRRVERTRLGRDLRQLRRLRERADRPAPTIIEPASPDLPPRPERPRMDVRIEIPAPVIEPASPDLPPRPERPRMDVRIEIPAPVIEPASPDLPPRPERPRMDVRIEIPAPVIEPASPDLPPRPERQRIEIPAPAIEPASPDLPPRPDPRDEERQRREEEKQRQRESEQLSYIERYAMDGGTERAGDQLTKHWRPAPTPALWDAVRTRLDDEQHAATTPVHKLQREIELEIVAVAEHGSKRSSRRIPPPQPEAVAEMVEAVKDRADKLMRPAAEAVGLDLPPRTAAPADEQPEPAPPASEAPQPRPERTKIETSPDLPPRPEPRDEERQRREDERRRRESEQVSYIERYAMDGGTERAGAQLAKRRPAPTRALWDAVRETLEDHHAVTPDDEPLEEARKRIEDEILAQAEHQSPRTSRRIPPPPPEAIKEMVEALQDRADKLMRPAAEAVGLDLPPRTAAPADEQPEPAPPASEAPQPEQPAAAADYKSAIAPVRNREAGPGGVDDTVKDVQTARDEADLADANRKNQKR